ncbi:MAG: hypothetical protein ABIG99_01235 [Patescibacteria group bacterium]
MNTQLLMQPNEVPLGAVVFPCLPGKPPATDAPLRLMAGGVPTRCKWYPCNVEGGNLSAGYEFDAFVSDDVLLAPAKAYTAENAPTGLELAVFIDNKGVKYEQYPSHHIEVTRLPDGTFMSICGYAYNHWLRRYTLPENAILVPHGDCKYSKTIDDAVVLPMMYEDSNEWKMLTENGATFYFQRSPWPNKTDKPDEFYYVWLPDGWALLPDEKQYTSAKSEKVVDATGTMRARVIWIEWNGRKEGGISLEGSVTLKSGEVFA